METFTQTSDKLYEKHMYKLVLSNGMEKVFENYYDLQQEWWSISPDLLGYVEVMDRVSKKGFGK